MAQSLVKTRDSICISPIGNSADSWESGSFASCRRRQFAVFNEPPAGAQAISSVHTPVARIATFSELLPKLCYLKVTVAPRIENCQEINVNNCNIDICVGHWSAVKPNE